MTSTGVMWKANQKIQNPKSKVLLSHIDAEIKIWITVDPQPIKKELKKNQDINEVY